MLAELSRVGVTDDAVCEGVRQEREVQNEGRMVSMKQGHWFIEDQAT